MGRRDSIARTWHGVVLYVRTETTKKNIICKLCVKNNKSIDTEVPSSQSQIMAEISNSRKLTRAPLSRSINGTSNIG